MPTSGGPAHEGTDPYISTGTLPAPEVVGDLLRATYHRHRGDSTGALSQVYPALAAAQPDQFGLALVSATGEQVGAGDATASFALMSVAKPFVYALVCDAIGADEACARVGVNATGLAFNSAIAIENDPDGRTNPMVNSGALVAASLAPGASVDAKWQWLCDGICAFAGRQVPFDNSLYENVMATNYRNSGLARLLYDKGALELQPDAAVELYSRQSCLAVTAVDLATMGATLATGGVQPATGTRVISRAAARAALTVMATAGLYEDSGRWLYDVGLPGKSGIAGGIVAIAPGKGALGSFSPRLDASGNSVRGTRAARDMSRGLGLDIFVGSTT